MENATIIIETTTKRKTEELSKNHKAFSSHFAFKSRRIKIEFEKEKITRKIHKSKAPILPYS